MDISVYIDNTNKVDHILEIPGPGEFSDYCFKNDTCQIRSNIFFFLSTLLEICKNYYERYYLKLYDIIIDIIQSTLRKML